MRSLPVLSMLLLSCAAYPATDGGETSGNAPVRPACEALAQQTSMRTPVETYAMVQECIRGKDYQAAVDLVALADVYGRFDAKRTSRETSFEIIDKLYETDKAFKQALERDEVKAFKAAFEKTFKAGSEDLARVCSSLRNVGPPAYIPSYGAKAPVIKENFDVASEWTAFLTSYMKCPP
jgi:hypothetical protein